MKKTLWFIYVSVFVCITSFTTVWAEEKKSEVKNDTAANTTMTDKEKAEYAKKADLFIQLATYGETQKDPLMTISAVKLLDDMPFKGILKPGQPENGSEHYDREAMLNQAKQFAAGDQELLAVIAKVQSPPEKIAVRGRHGRDHGYGHGHSHGYGYGRYYDRPRHHRHFGCNWMRVCRHGDCFMVCR